MYTVLFVLAFHFISNLFVYNYLICIIQLNFSIEFVIIHLLSRWLTVWSLDSLHPYNQWCTNLFQLCGHPGLHLRLLPSIFSMIYPLSPSKDLLKHIEDVPQSTRKPGVSVTSLCLFWITTIRICIFCCCINYIWRRFFISRKRKSEHQVISCQPTRLGKVWIQCHQYIYIMNFVDSLHLLI